jgi:hypothetical protein
MTDISYHVMNLHPASDLMRVRAGKASRMQMLKRSGYLYPSMSGCCKNDHTPSHGAKPIPWENLTSRAALPHQHQDHNDRAPRVPGCAIAHPQRLSWQAAKQAGRLRDSPGLSVLQPTAPRGTQLARTHGLPSLPLPTRCFFGGLH